MTDPTSPSSARFDAPDLPETLSNATLSSGLAVPYITVVHRNRAYRPAWGSVDPHRLREILDRTLCQVCGEQLGEDVIVFIRPDDYERGVAVEPGLDPLCAEYSMQACPMLAGRIHRYNPHPETRLAHCADPLCQCRLWIFPGPGERGAPRPAEAWYAIRLPRSEYRVVTAEATEHNPAVTGIDLRTPSLMRRIRRIRAAADTADARTDPLALLLVGQKLFGGNLG